MSEDDPFHRKHSRRIKDEVNVELYQLEHRDDAVEAVVEFTNEGPISCDLKNIRGILFSSSEDPAIPGLYEKYSGVRDISLPARSSRRLAMRYEVGARPVDSLKIQVADAEITLPIGDLPGR
jgi:hypothetical protein